MLARDTGKGEVLSAAPVAEQDGEIAPAHFTISIEARGLDRAESWPGMGR